MTVRQKALTNPNEQLYIFRKDDPAGDRDNVYTTWATLYAKIDATRSLGRRSLQFDSRFSTDAPIFGFVPTINIPDGTWDMSEVNWQLNSDSFSGTGVRLGDATHNDVHILNLDSIEMTWGFICNDSLTNIPLVLNANVTPGRQVDQLTIKSSAWDQNFFLGEVVGAKPIFQVSGDFGYMTIKSYAGGATQLGTGSTTDGFALLNPVLDLNGHVLVTSISFDDGSYTDSAGGGVLVTVGADCSMTSNRSGDVTYQGFDATIIAPGAGILWDMSTTARPRYRLTNTFGANTDTVAYNPNPSVVPAASTATTNAKSPYPAIYNQIVCVDTTDSRAAVPTPGPVTVLLPTAYPARGDVIIVKDWGGNSSAVGQTITITPQAGECIDNGAPGASITITTDGGSVTLSPDGNAGPFSVGPARWMII